MQNLFIEIQGRVVVLVHSSVTYTPDEWRSLLALVRRRDLANLRVLVHNDGGLIDSAQRRELIDTMGARMPVAAVFTTAVISRGVVTALGWFKPGIKAFAPQEFDKAACHLDLTPKERVFARRTADELLAHLARKTA